MTQVVQSYRFGAAITPGSTDLATPVDAVYVGGAGSLVCTLSGDTSAVTFAGLPAGSLIRAQIKNVGSGSTATSLIGLRY